MNAQHPEIPKEYCQVLEHGSSAERVQLLELAALGLIIDPEVSLSVLRELSHDTNAIIAEAAHVWSALREIDGISDAIALSGSTHTKASTVYELLQVDVALNRTLQGCLNNNEDGEPRLSSSQRRMLRSWLVDEHPADLVMEDLMLALLTSEERQGLSSPSTKESENGPHGHDQPNTQRGHGSMELG